MQLSQLAAWMQSGPPWMLGAAGLFLAALPGAAPRGRRRAQARGACLGRPARAGAARRRGAVREGCVELAGVRIGPLRRRATSSSSVPPAAASPRRLRRCSSAALRRGDRAVITDRTAATPRASTSAAAADVILNPFDARSVKWDPFAEILAP